MFLVSPNELKIVLKMIRFHNTFFCHCTRLLKRTPNNRYIQSTEKPNPTEKFNSLEKPKYLRPNYLETSKIASRICLTVIGNGAVGQPRCLCMFTDYRSYMFNCGEGSVRLTKEHEINMLSVRQIFITEKTWENMAGIADVYLTHQSYGIPKLTLHGPPGLDQFEQIIISFKRLRYGIKSIEDSPYSDDTIEIDYVPIYKKNFRPSKFRNPDAKDPQPHVIVSYICKIKDRPGDFLFKKCVEFGVPIGPLLLDLKNGKDVELPSGKCVKASDVHSHSYPGFTFFVVDCPYETLLNDFVSEPKFSKYQHDSEEKVFAIFHFSPQCVVQSYKYQQWMSRFPKTTLHFLLNSSNPSLSSKAVHQIQYTLNLLHPRIFPLLHEQPGNETSSLLESSENIIPAEAMLQLHLRPKIELDRSNVIKLCPETYINEAKEVPGFYENVVSLRKSIEQLENAALLGDSNLSYPEVIFLGTGSSTSTAYRNVTGILVNISPNNSILLDCGEGIYLQLLRYFGYHNISSVLKNISCIFLSHHHCDHYVGLFRLLKARKEAFLSCSEPFSQPAVLSTRPINQCIKNFNYCFESIRYDIRMFRNEAFAEEKTYDLLHEFIGDLKICTVPVLHCNDAYGIVLSGKDWKIVYSGDAAPSQSLIDAGKDCTLLIHEASIEDGLCNEASNKKHSTPSQVVDIGEQMRARHIILTHFSKRYLAVPLLPEVKSSRVGCAFDNMCVKLCDLPILPLFIPSLKCLFAEPLEQLHETAVSKGTFEESFFKSLKV